MIKFCKRKEVQGVREAKRRKKMPIRWVKERLLEKVTRQPCPGG